MPLSPERFAIDASALEADRRSGGRSHGLARAASLPPHSLRAASARRACACELCGFATQSASGLQIDGFGGKLPDAVIVRSMSGGTFEAVTLRLGVLHALRERGVLVWNDARAIERCVDKSMTSFLLARAGIRDAGDLGDGIIRGGRCKSRNARRGGTTGAQAAVRLAGPRIEVDPPTGGPCRSLATRPAGCGICNALSAVERDGFHDFRLLVVQGRVVAAMQRHSPHWITNVKRGGRPVAAVVNDDMNALAVAAATAVGADFAGVDILYGADQRPMVLEVNSMPAWSGLQKVTPVHIASVVRRRPCRCSRRARAARGHGVTSRAEEIAAAFKWACLAELDAPKPGNVHVFAAGHRMTAERVRRQRQCRRACASRRQASASGRAFSAPSRRPLPPSAPIPISGLFCCARRWPRPLRRQPRPARVARQSPPGS